MVKNIVNNYFIHIFIVWKQNKFFKFINFVLILDTLKLNVKFFIKRKIKKILKSNWWFYSEIISNGQKPIQF